MLPFPGQGLISGFRSFLAKPWNQTRPGSQAFKALRRLRIHIPTPNCFILTTVECIFFALGSLWPLMGVYPPHSDKTHIIPPSTHRQMVPDKVRSSRMLRNSELKTTCVVQESSNVIELVVKSYMLDNKTGESSIWTICICIWIMFGQLSDDVRSVLGLCAYRFMSSSKCRFVCFFVVGGGWGAFPWQR